jgi:hypothetical protein
MHFHIRKRSNFTVEIETKQNETEQKIGQTPTKLTVKSDTPEGLAFPVSLMTYICQ